jgi:hypothetical protein
MKKFILFILAIIFLYICIYFFIRNTYFPSRIIEGYTNVKDNVLITYLELAANSSMNDISNNANVVQMIKNTITEQNSPVTDIVNDNTLDDNEIIKKIAKYYNVSLSPSFYTLKEKVQNLLNNNTSSLWFNADNSSNFIFDNTRITSWKDTQQKFNATIYGNIEYNSTKSSVVLPIGSYFKSSLNIGVPNMTWFFVFSTDTNFNANSNFNGDHFILASSVVPWTNYAIQVYKNQIYIPIIGGNNINGMNIYVDSENIVANKVYLLSISLNASENNYSYETAMKNSIIRLNGKNLDIQSGGSLNGYTFTNSNGVQFGGLLDNAYTNDRNQYINEIIAISGKSLKLNDIVMVENYLKDKWKLPYTIDLTTNFNDLTSMNNLQLWLNTSSFSKDNANVIWKDKSGKNNNMIGTNASSVNKVEYNNISAIHFQQSYKSLKNENIQVATFPMTYFIVYSIDNGSFTGNDYNQMLSANFFDDNGTYIGYPHNELQLSVSPDGNQFFIGSTNGVISNYVQTNASSKLCLLMIQLDGSGNNISNIFVNVNGLNQLNKQNINHDINPQCKGVIIRPSLKDMYICEIAYFQSLLSKSDIKKVEGYLAWKWKINNNLSSEHTYFEHAP